MSFAVLELGDPSLLIQAAGGTLYSEPGFARLEPNGIETGDAARASAWVEPQRSYNQYWSQLNETPLPAKEKWARHHADIAFAQLRRLWGEAGSPGELVLLVPGSFNEQQLSLLLGLVTALPARPLAVMDSALAACLDTRGDTLFVELQLHRCVVSLCRAGNGAVSIEDQEVFPDLGLTQIQNSVARHISNLLIDSHRYDPLHASESEQAIYDQQPEWLLRLGWEDEVPGTLPSVQGELPMILRRAAVMRLVGERLASIRSFLGRHANARRMLSHASGLLAGLSEDFAGARVAAQAAGIEHCLAHHEQLRNQGEGLVRIRSLATGASSGAVEAEGGLATHLLYGDRAVPLHRPVSVWLSDGDVRIANAVDGGAALTVVLRNAALETLHQGPVESVLPRSCRPGESLVVGGREFRLIEVNDG